MRLTVLHALALACCWFQTAQAAPTPADWLDENACKITSISSQQTEFSDLACIGDAIGDSRVVFLGEASHGDGRAFEAKARLIRYLHEELGFNVLAWEAGMWGVHEMGRILDEGGLPGDAAHAALFPIWADSAQVQDVFEYAAASRHTAAPLELVGFDANVTGSAGLDEWVEYLLQYLDHRAPGMLSEKLQAELRSIPLGSQAGPPSLEGLRAYQGSVRTACELWNDAAATDPGNLDDIFATRLLKQLGDTPELAVKMLSAAAPDSDDPQAAQAAQLTAFKAMANERERQMIGNLIWLAEEAYPREKIIVWAASAHCLRNFPEMSYPEYREDLTHKVSLGQGAYDVLGANVYALALIAAGGRTGTPGNEPSEIGQPEPGSLEDHLLATGEELLFIDLRGNAETFRAAFSTELSAAPLGYAPMIGDWTKAADGFLFIAEMQPSRQASSMDSAIEQDGA